MNLLALLTFMANDAATKPVVDKIAAPLTIPAQGHSIDTKKLAEQYRNGEYAAQLKAHKERIKKWKQWQAERLNYDLQNRYSRRDSIFGQSPRLNNTWGSTR